MPLAACWAAVHEGGAGIGEGGKRGTFLQIVARRFVLLDDRLRSDRIDAGGDVARAVLDAQPILRVLGEKYFAPIVVEPVDTFVVARGRPHRRGDEHEAPRHEGDPDRPAPRAWFHRVPLLAEPAAGSRHRSSSRPWRSSRTGVGCGGSTERSYS